MSVSEKEGAGLVYNAPPITVMLTIRKLTLGFCLDLKTAVNRLLCFLILQPAEKQSSFNENFRSSELSG